MLDAGAKIDVLDHLWASPLMLAARIGSSEAVQIFLDRGADADILDCEEHSALDHALRNKSWEESRTQRIVDMILAHQKKPNCDNSLSVVIYFDRAEMFKVFYRHGWDVLTGGKDGRTALHSLARHGSIHCLRALFDCDSSALAYVNTPDECGMTPLNTACASAKDEVTRFLLGKGGDVNLSDAAMCTPLLSTLPFFSQSPTPFSSQDARMTLSLLLRHGCDVNFKGYSPEARWTRCCEWDNKPHPALAWALARGHREAVDALWIAGTSRNSLKDCELENAFHGHEKNLSEEAKAHGLWFLKECHNKPRTLQECSRMAARKAMHTDVDNKVKSLPVPDRIKVYLNLPELDNALGCTQINA